MAQVVGTIKAFVNAKAARTIDPIPGGPPAQRGPNCGFYALAYVLTYWHERGMNRGENFASAKSKPLPARKNEETAPDRPAGATHAQFQGLLADFKHREGSFGSLREFAKYHHLTVVGSVFDANDLVKVAQGEDSSYAGQFDGCVATVTVQSLPKLVMALLDEQCPVIVPYDFDDKPTRVGEPGLLQGKHAHWVPLIGYFMDGGEPYAIYYNLGEFQWAKLSDFALSNDQLSSNDTPVMAKYELRDKLGNVMERAYMTQDSYDKALHSNPGWTGTKFPNSERINPEFNDPTLQGARPDGAHFTGPEGKDRLAVGGLRNRVVAIYRKEESDKFRRLVFANRT